MGAEKTDAAKQYAFRLVAARPRTRREIICRLKRKGYSGEAARGAVKTLERTGYIDDEQFSRDFIEAKLRALPAGKKYLRAELLKKGVDEQTAERALEENLPPGRELEAACSAALKVFSRCAGLKGEARLRKVYGHLLRRGFSTETAGNAMAKTGCCSWEE